MATKRILAATEEREQLRSNARQEAEKWGWAAATRQLKRYYESVLDQDVLPRVA